MVQLDGIRNHEPTHF